MTVIARPLDVEQRPRIHTEAGPMQPAPGETLLETLERHGIEVEYQCRSGYCGACRTPLLAGTVDYLQTPLAFVASGECLPCCCRPVGSVQLSLKRAR
ncbi:class I ribonucleotide reductase maintenance protein YfaE [Aeromonas simiae]|uniref:2Fe-2S ferredoxin-like protein n=1 Tax=Aeromonas simiae TaxID=218936 RepID=A0A5J6WX20_9GAMM|nr:class I ribonucleotide reductase maintenance protein YfaE [Aeromonas simiae]QFI54741.1 2Fe-2S ferredoxin-like protein [Aeromonas simiae]